MLKIPGFDFRDLFGSDRRVKEVFNSSRKVEEGLLQKEQDFYQGMMYGNGKSVVDAGGIALGDAYADFSTITDTFIINKSGKALITFNAKWTGTDDDYSFGAFCKIVVDGSDVTGSERADRMDLYVDDPVSGALNVLQNALISPAYSYVGTSAIINLLPGSHTIKIQMKRKTANAQNVKVYEARMDIILWASAE